MPSIKSEYLLCDDNSLLEEVIESLTDSPTLILDCEAKDLGSIGGQLSLLNLGIASSLSTSKPCTEPNHPIFLIDVLAFTKAELRPLYDFLEDPSVLKVVFDGRQDFSELWHGEGVELKNVIDLQLADITSRSLRGEGQREQLQRLGRYLKRDEVNRPDRRSRYTRIHKVCGLEACVREHDFTTVYSGSQASPDHSKWLSRPLTASQLSYAARDISYIDSLYSHFKKMGYIRPSLTQESEEYITLHLDSRPSSDDRFVRHPLLPLQILDKTAHINPVQCQGCKRTLPPDCFPSHQTPRHRYRADGTDRENKCFVCSALDYVFRRTRVIW
ncbi:hypothetical protein SISNIDRAFT_279833 [Sistotremastrum niveocremeum HHB9708]|uniref:3'-5' exonuclease domain-containing protein n=2 Tax=Sistotremastraceae TaxID=3402574 RepID=A0A164NR42_9AGAM|nr:hypothetical protein SISNIDRAFT_279833 [Sistotremastrum niveocremeum HHB9708]KZT38440.1 hypothetical protein SISSUDRAFT_1033394 [Sistotremastrum suecicum HHB10207 ss-3]